VACRQYGYFAGEVMSSTLPLACADEPIRMNNVTSDGWESRLIECQFTLAAERRCVHEQDVYVQCRHEDTSSELHFPFHAFNYITENAISFQALGVSMNHLFSEFTCH
jgi:hypothetical protein